MPVKQAGALVFGTRRQSIEVRGSRQLVWADHIAPEIGADKLQDALVTTREPIDLLEAGGQ